MKIKVEDFVEQLTKLSDEPAAFIGMAKILGVQILSEEKDEDGKFLPRSAESITSDMIEKYNALNRSKKRLVMGVLTGRFRK